MRILLENEAEAAFDFSPEEQIKYLAEAVLQEEKFPYETEISVSIVSKEDIHQINSEFRAVDRSTDVLSFPMMEYEAPADFTSEKFLSSLTKLPETGEVLLGDIVLCADVIKKQAKEYGHSELREFSFLVVHSLLHLLGYDHKEEKDRIIMEKKQDDLMEKLQIQRD